MFDQVISRCTSFFHCLVITFLKRLQTLGSYVARYSICMRSRFVFNILISVRVLCTVCIFKSDSESDQFSIYLLNSKEDKICILMMIIKHKNDDIVSFGMTNKKRVLKCNYYVPLASHYIAILFVISQKHVNDLNILLKHIISVQIQSWSISNLIPVADTMTDLTT